MEAILDFSRPLDVAVLDTIVAVCNDPRNPQRSSAEAVLTAFQAAPDAWTRVDSILERSASSATRFFALQVLEQLIKFRWRSLPPPQREGVRTYVVQKIILLASNEMTLRAEFALISKLDGLLVEVLKHDWPAGWPGFITDIVGASKTSELLCENNVNILRMLSEEVFDFSKGRLTIAKAEALKRSLHAELGVIFDLFQFILQVATRPSLVNATLTALQRYVTWIPDAYVFQTRLLEMCCTRFLQAPAHRLPTIGLLTEVAALAKPEYDTIFQQLYLGVLAQLVRIIPPDADIKTIYAGAATASDESTLHFMRQLALFLCAYFRAHVQLLEADAFHPALVAGMNYLVAMSDIEDHEIFKICVEYWMHLASDVYAAECAFNPLTDSAASNAAAHINMLAAAVGGRPAPPPAVSPRKALYVEILARVREIMINHMAKPEEVLIEEDEAGEVIRERNKNTEAVELYKVMKDTLVYLTHLDPRNTEEIMIEKLSRQMDESIWDWAPLNKLCWAIGSISGAMSEAEEKRFLVLVIKDLLTMCERKKGKNHKAVVASNIMYVVGQYPRFLRAHWKFLRTVVLKLFEFMHERHPGVQDMAVETFLKITQKCKRKFVQLQPEERMIFVEELCNMLPAPISDLETHQVHIFYEAAGHMVAAHTDAGAREILTERLMTLPNTMWTRAMSTAASDINVLTNPEQLREIQRVLRTNVSACRSIGPSFAKQLGKLYLDMLNVYKAISNFVTATITASGPTAAQTAPVRAMIGVKKEVLTLVATYINRAEDPKFVAAHFIPPLLEPVLNDYAMAVPAARDAEVLVLLTEIVNKLRGDILPDVPRMLEAVFEPTLSMISANQQEFPDHRIALFRLLEAVNMHCFPAIMSIAPAHQKLVVDSIVWAFKHTAPDIGELGLKVLSDLLENVQGAGPDVAQPFFAAYFLSLVQDILAVMTDRLHKGHVKLHTAIMRRICTLVETGAVITPLWDAPFAVATGVTAHFRAKLELAASANGGVVPPALLTNQQFVREYVRVVVSRAFTNLTAAHVESFVSGLFDVTCDPKQYKSHLRDFLIKVLQFGGEDDQNEGDLFADERAASAQNMDALAEARRRNVPGLANPYDMLPDHDPNDL